MKFGYLVLLACLCAASRADAQHAAPVAVRARIDRLASAAISVDSIPMQGSIRGKRVVLGALIGAVVVAPLGWFLEQGACEDGNCGSGRNGLAGGAALGALLGGVVGLLADLPSRAE